MYGQESRNKSSLQLAQNVKLLKQQDFPKIWTKCRLWFLSHGWTLHREEHVVGDVKPGVSWPRNSWWNNNRLFYTQLLNHFGVGFEILVIKGTVEPRDIFHGDALDLVDSRQHGDCNWTWIPHHRCVAGQIRYVAEHRLSKPSTDSPPDQLLRKQMNQLKFPKLHQPQEQSWFYPSGLPCSRAWEMNVPKLQYWSLKKSQQLSLFSGKIGQAFVWDWYTVQKVWNCGFSNSLYAASWRSTTR